MAEIPPVACEDFPCSALLKFASRVWSSFSRAIGAIVCELWEGIGEELEIGEYGELKKDGKRREKCSGEC